MSNDRDEWIALGIRMLDEGRVPAEIGYARAAAEIGVGIGSFNHHFGKKKGGEGVAEWHAAIIAKWHDDHKNARAEQAIELTGDPEEKLLRLRLAAERHAARDGAMRRWAAYVAADTPVSCADKAQEALMESDKEIFADVEAALLDMGLPPRQVEALALVLAPEVGCGWPQVPVGDSEKFRALIEVPLLAAQAARPSAARVVEVTGDDGEVVLGVVAIRPGADASEIEAGVRQLAQRIRPGGRTGTAVAGGTSRRR